MSDPLTYWDDQEFVHKHYPSVSQAYADGISASAEPFLIPDGRVLRVSLTRDRIYCLDVLPSTDGDVLMWGVSRSFVDGGARRIMYGVCASRRESQKIAEEHSEGTYRVL